MSGNAILDYETASVITFTIIAQDSGIPNKILEKAMTVYITDVSEPPEIIRLTNNQVSFKNTCV